MKQYQCKVCSNQTKSNNTPTIYCDVCGSLNWMLISTNDKINFEVNKFRLTIESYCREINWKIAKIDEKMAMLRFPSDAPDVGIIVYIVLHGKTLEFSCPSLIRFDSLDEIPHSLSTILLSRNCEYKVGFWCIEKIQKKLVFSIMHNAELSLINVEYFKLVVLKLVDEYLALEQFIAQLK